MTTHRMPPRLRLFYSAFTAGLLLIPVVALYSELSKCPDIRAARLPFVLFYAAACGAGAMLLLIVATGRLAYRGEKAAP